MAEITFRDFAAAIMGNDTAAAARALEHLLGLDAPAASEAASHFQQQMATVGPAFMMKAMGLRAALGSGSDDDMRNLLGECFGLRGEAATGAVATLRAKYPG